MPAEIQNKILAHAGILTLWLNGRIDDLSNISLDQFKALLSDVFELDWQGDLTTLPFEKFKHSRLNEPFWHMRSRGMHARVKALGFNFHEDGLDQAAILNGWTDLLNFGDPRQIGIKAARCGSISMLQHLVDERKAVRLVSSHVEEAATYGHLEVLKWIHERMPDGNWPTWVMDCAAWSGKLDCVKWLHANRTEGCTTKAIDYAAHSGHLDVVKWLHKNSTEGCTTKAMDFAASNGHLDVVKWLHANRTEGCTVRAMDVAAENGHLNVVKWLHANRTEGCTVKAIDHAATKGRLDVVQWLHNNRTEGCTTIAMDYAAYSGHLDVVEFLHKNRTEGRIVEAAKFAARGDQPAVIKHIQKLAPDAITDTLVDEAASSGSRLALEWLIKDAGVQPTDSMISKAINAGQLDMLSWFCKHTPEVFRAHPASKVGNQAADAVFDWFDRNNLPEVWDVVRLAIEERQVLVVKWLLEHMVESNWYDGDLEQALELVDIE
ncbi:hypothetical protein HK105_206396 [Polyrhizophydium stewartii]|uniref:Ankyrin repeat protein n=1 Tax=Polyrhizophydium stewartii TaxID=2732419 RepID=A0ABR4N3M0_9FUNG